MSRLLKYKVKTYSRRARETVQRAWANTCCSCRSPQSHHVAGSMQANRSLLQRRAWCGPSPSPELYPFRHWKVLCCSVCPQVPIGTFPACLVLDLTIWSFQGCWSQPERWHRDVPLCSGKGSFPGLSQSFLSLSKSLSAHEENECGQGLGDKKGVSVTDPL